MQSEAWLSVGSAPLVHSSLTLSDGTTSCHLPAHFGCATDRRRQAEVTQPVEQSPGPPSSVLGGTRRGTEEVPPPSTRTAIQHFWRSEGIIGGPSGASEEWLGALSPVPRAPQRSDVCCPPGGGGHPDGGGGQCPHHRHKPAPTALPIEQKTEEWKLREKLKEVA